MVRRVRIKDHFAEQRIFTVRSIVAAVLVSVLLLTVAGRLFYLQVLKYAYYAELAQGNLRDRVMDPPDLVEIPFRPVEEKLRGAVNEIASLHHARSRCLSKSSWKTGKICEASATFRMAKL